MRKYSKVKWSLSIVLWYHIMIFSLHVFYNHNQLSPVWSEHSIWFTEELVIAEAPSGFKRDTSFQGDFCWRVTICCCRVINCYKRPASQPGCNGSLLLRPGPPTTSVCSHVNWDGKLCYYEPRPLLRDWLAWHDYIGVRWRRGMILIGSRCYL